MCSTGKHHNIFIFEQFQQIKKLFKNMNSHQLECNFNVSDYFQPQDQFQKYIVNCIQKQGNAPWKLLNNLKPFLEQILVKFPHHAFNQDQGKVNCQGSVYMENKEQIYIGEGTKIKHGASIYGPCIMGKNCEIGSGAIIHSDMIIGDNTFIGQNCEVKRSIFMTGCQVSHLNYVGDSILGRKAHFAAGAIVSNYKLDGSSIKVKMEEKVFDSQRTKLGAIVGDCTDIGCNSVLNPGSLIGRNSVVYPLVNFRGQLGPAKICKLIQQQTVVEKQERYRK